MTDCLFCKIVAHDIPASIVYEDDRLLAFDDINPQAPIHLLVVTKRHIASLNDLAPEDDRIVGAMVRRAAATSTSCSAAEKMLGCGFMKPCSDEDTVAAMSPSSSKCDWNDARQRCELEINPRRMPAAASARSTAGTSSYSSKCWHAAHSA